MSSSKPTLPVPRHPRVFWSRILWRWPVLVWIGIAFFAWWLFDHGGDYLRINGMVEVTTESAAPLRTGRLMQIFVIPGQRVDSGQVLAQMDTSLVDEEIAVLEQEIRQDRADDERQFISAEQRLRSELREYTLEEAEATTELVVYEEELKRLLGLMDSGFVNASDVADLRVQVASLKSNIALYNEYRKNLEKELEKMAANRAEIMEYYDALERQDYVPSQLNLLYRRRDNMTIRAQRAGVISRIRREPGEVLQEGERVVDILTDRPPRILAFMNETDVRAVKVGDVVEIEPAIGGTRFQARLVALSPNFISLEDRASPLPNQLVRGRRLELIPIEDIKLTPGASMVVFLPPESRVKAFLGGEK